MTILYRSPNVVIAAHEWHASVEMYHGRVARYCRFRPNSVPKRKWQDVSKWVGPKPTWREFEKAFGPFKRHMLQAARGRVMASSRILLAQRAMLLDCRCRTLT